MNPITIGGLKNGFCSLALVAILVMGTLATAHTGASGATCPAASVPGAAASVEAQLGQTAEKLARLPVSTYAGDSRLAR